MTYEQFQAKILADLREYYGADAKVEMQAVFKNNGVEYIGINIRLAEDDNIVPVIYLEKYFDMYKQGTDIDECVERIINLREETSVSNVGINYPVDMIRNWEDAKECIYPLLVNTKKNQMLLDSVVHKDFLDLSVIYIIKISESGYEGMASTKITNQLFELYGVSTEELYETAIMNMKKEKYKLVDMETVMHQMMGDIDEKEEVLQLIEPDRMYVLTNQNKMYGAAGLLNSEFLEACSNGRSFYILPSSVHETIFVPDTNDIDVDNLNAMIVEVNETQVEEQDILSDHAYYYDGKELRIA